MSENQQFHPNFREFNHQTGKEKNGYPHPYFEEDDMEIEEEDYALTDELDHEILMHRDAHFGGDFKVMLDYYLTSGIGVNPDFEIERIKYLAEVEQQLGKNLAPLLLTGPEAERVAKAREAYRLFKDLYEREDEKNDLDTLLIADLILSEEEEPEEAISAILFKGSRLVPLLIEIVNSDETYDPLFPGYGYAPYLAILCLGKIGDAQAIVPIFETLSRETIFGEEVVLEALASIGESAKKFLLQLISARPLTRDNVNAAFALSVFLQDETVASAAFAQLKDPAVREKPLLSIYLLCCCENLKDSKLRKEFMELAQDPETPQDLGREMVKIANDWKELKKR